MNNLQLRFLNYARSNHMDGRMERNLEVLNGPQNYPNFRAMRWQYTTNARRYPLYTEINNRQVMADQARADVTTLIEDALQIAVNDGAGLDDVVHLYMRAQGLDQQYAFNPAGQFAVTYRQLINNEGGRLDAMVNDIARAVQSGRKVVIDRNTVFTLYAYNVPVGGTRMRAYHADDLITRSKSIIRVVNSDNSCFLRAVFLSLQRQISMSSFRQLYKSERYMLELLAEFSANTGWDTSRRVSLMDITYLADVLRCVVHVYDISNGNKPRFVFHSEPYHTKHVYVLLIDCHFHMITNISSILRTFSRCTTTEFCTTCCRIWDNRTPHVCGGEGDDDIVAPKKKRYEVGDVTLPHFPYIGDKKEELKFVVKLEPKPAENRRILYLDFETYVQGTHRLNEGPEPRPSRADLPAPQFEPYCPYPFIDRELDTEHWSYEQKVNWCEVQDEEGVVTCFGNLDDVMNWLSDPINNKTIVIAHCGGSFDFQFLFERFLKSDILKLKSVEAPLMRGNKIVKGWIQNDIQLLDSYSFVSCALEKFPAIFGLDELKKGYFPHVFNRPEFWGYVGPIPDVEYYQPQLYSPAKRQSFYEWHAARVEERAVFNFRKEMTEYCHSDVCLLRQGMMKFRSLFLDLKDVDGNWIGADPYNYITIAGVAFDGVYRTHFLPENTIQIVPRPTEEHTLATKSLWLELEESKVMDPLERLNVNGEPWRFNNVPVDALDVHRTTAYVFHSCFYHGCTKCYNAYTKCPHRTTSYYRADGKLVNREIRFGEIYAHTLKDMELIRQTGVTVVEMWECQFQKNLNKEDLLRYDPLKPLVPRDAYFGGRVNGVKLYYRATGTERIHYVDVTSMYPSVMSLEKYYYPIGQPTILKKTMEDVFVPLDQLFGLMKCHVIPPSNLYHPYLPRRFASGKVLFDLEPCIGTWTHIELQRAVAAGYVIDEIYEQHHFPNTSNTLFRRYNETFFTIKRQAKLGGNKGLESIAKMCINAPTGKWGFNPSKQQRTELVTDCDQFYRYLCGDYQSVMLSILSQDVAVANIRDADGMTEHHKSNVYISAFITGYARVMLIDDVFEPLGRNVLYYDTDSAIYVSPTGEHLLPVNTRGELGTWASELPVDDHFVEFASSGPKTYSCRSASGDRNVSKSKGFHLHWENSTIFHMDSLKDAVHKKARGETFEKLKLHANETIMRRDAFHISVSNNPGKVLNMTYDKRYICEPVYDEFGQLKSIDTLPWGHEDIPL